jgi:hypothetical protein
MLVQLVDRLGQGFRRNYAKAARAPRPRAPSVSASGTKRVDLLFVRFWGEADMGAPHRPIVSAAVDPKPS